MIKTKYIATTICAVAFLLGYNYFLIQRDQKMFDAYYQQIHHDT